MSSKVLKEVRAAYSDCNDMKVERNLSYKAQEFVSRDEAFSIMESALPRGYNEFRASLINYFHKDHKFKIAREGSVCLYVLPKDGIDMPSMEELKADEYGMEDDGTLRVWWD